MEKNGKLSLIVPILMITAGSGWLLTIHKFIPGVDWIWTLGLGVVGILILAMGGIDKVNIVSGPLLVICSGLSVLRQTGGISVETEIPILVIIAGVLVLIARSLPIPMPKWAVEESEHTKH